MSSINQAQWNFIKKYFTQSFVNEMKEFDVLAKKDDDDYIEMIDEIKKKIKNLNSEELFNTSKGAGTMLQWLEV